VYTSSGPALTYNLLSTQLKSDYFLNVANIRITHKLTCGLKLACNLYLKRLSVQWLHNVSNQMHMKMDVGRIHLYALIL